jgi:hypothetical protein
MTMTYQELLTNLPDQDARLLVLWAMGQRIYSNEIGEATVFKNILDNSFNQGYLIKTVEGKERRDGVNWQYFEAVVAPEVAPMLATLAQERLMLSRLPINI